MLRFLLVLAMAIPLWPRPAASQVIPLPTDLTGTHNGTTYRIRVPANWNGTLLVYAHGTASTEVEVAPVTFPPASPTLEEQLLSQGYALAGSLFRDSIKDGPADTLALTTLFNGTIGRPRRTIVWGISLGGSVALKLIETHSGIYDAAIPISPVAGGATRDADFQLRYGLAYAAAFGWPSEWWGPIHDLRDDLCGNEATLIMPVFQWAHAGNYGQWEFVRLVMKLPWSVWWDVEPTLGLPGWALDGWKATAVRSCLEQFSGGPIAENVGDFYELATEEEEYLSTLGVNAGELLAAMNAQTTITASLPARRHVEHYADPTGDLDRPVLTMHGMFDPMLPPSHAALYGAAVGAAGQSDMLVQVFTRTAHASFSADQIFATLAAMESWLDTGVRPGASFFPESLGFDTSFIPPPWPY